MILNGKHKLYGLVLAGGKSRRMGTNKGLMNFHGLSQRHFVAKQMQDTGIKDVYLSLAEKETERYPVLVDQYPGKGPLGAILTAFAYAPDAFWMVMACDLPLISTRSLKSLIENLDAGDDMICLTDIAQQPQPTASIWAPSSLPAIRREFFDGKGSLFTAMKSLSVRYITPDTPEELLNMNTPEDREKVIQLLKNQKN